jgi:hypothetical protein
MEVIVYHVTVLLAGTVASYESVKFTVYEEALSTAVDRYLQFIGGLESSTKRPIRDMIIINTIKF